MSTLLDRINVASELSAPILSAKAKFASDGPRLLLTSATAVNAAIQAGKNIINNVGEAPDPSLTPDPTDPVNNQINY